MALKASDVAVSLTGLSQPTIDALQTHSNSVPTIYLKIKEFRI